jgi:hypothetical protein
MNPLTEVFGDTPDVAAYRETNLGDEQLRALRENLAAMPDISKLGGQYYDYMLGLLNRSIPGFSDILSQGGALTKKMQGIAADELGGNIPQDVINQVQRSTAFQNLGSGLLGSSAGGANLARNLGLNSLDMIDRGMRTQAGAGNAAQQWATIASGLNMNPSSFFVTPSEQAGMTMQNNLYKQQTQQLRNNLNAAPNPVAKGVSDTIINLIGAYLGAGKGGGAGGTAPSYSPSQYAGQQAIQPGNMFSSGNAGGAPNMGVEQFNMGSMSPFGQPNNAASYDLNTGAGGGVDLYSSYQPFMGSGLSPGLGGGAWGAPSYPSGYSGGYGGPPPSLFNSTSGGGPDFSDLVF